MKKIKLKEQLGDSLRFEFGKNIKNASKEQLFYALSKVVTEYYVEDWQNNEVKNFKEDRKQAYYFSSEFLMGRFLGNNIINLQVEDEIKDLLKELNIDYSDIESKESDAALGNGGLGRLAACFLDSAATHKLPLHGYGIRYQYGIFKQKIEDGFQVEYPNNWLKYGNPWELKKYNEKVEVRFGGDVEVHFKAGAAHFDQQN